MVFETFSVRVYQKGGRDFSPHPKPPVISPITTTHKVVGSDPLPIMSGPGVASRFLIMKAPTLSPGEGPSARRAARGVRGARRAARGVRGKGGDFGVFQLDHVEEELGAETSMGSCGSVTYMIAHPSLSGRALCTIVGFGALWYT